MIIDKMTEWQHTQVDYKIAPEDSLSIIGSNSIHTRGDLYTVHINAVDKVANRRNKRLLDIVLSLHQRRNSPAEDQERSAESGQCDETERDR